MSLSSIYADHVAKEDKLRDPMRLFVSDVGKCPRQIAYRLLSTERDYKSEQAIINRTIMFDLADFIESQLWEALGDKGIAYQFEVTMPDRENWGGRGDIIAQYEGRRVIEVKTIYPGAFSYAIDYPQHQHQATIYNHYCWDTYELTENPLLAYFDRGGQNTPVEQVVQMPWYLTKNVMDELDTVRFLVQRDASNLPPQLPRILKERDWKKNIKQEPDHRCKYCDYAETCQPNMSVNVWASRKNTKEPYVPTKAADAELIEAFTNTLISEAMDD